MIVLFRDVLTKQSHPSTRLKILGVRDIVHIDSNFKIWTAVQLVPSLANSSVREAFKIETKKKCEIYNTV